MYPTRPDRAAARVLAAILLSAALAGCSSPKPPTAEVSGKVTFNKKPVTEGMVTFVSPQGKGDAEAKINPDGTYTLSNPIGVGEYTVTVTPLMEMKDTDPGKSPPALVEKPAPNIPMKYRQPGTTPLKPTIKEGKQEFNIEMTP